MEFQNCQDQTVNLLDGRKLGYAEYGPTVSLIKRNPKAAVKRIFANLPPGDQAVLQQPEVIEAMVRDLPEAYRQGGRGGAHDFEQILQQIVDHAKRI